MPMADHDAQMNAHTQWLLQQVRDTAGAVAATTAVETTTTEEQQKQQQQKEQQ